MIAVPIPAEARPKISARARLQTDKLTGKPVLLYPEGILVLNSTGHAIVLLCTGERTFADIVRDLAARYNTPAESIAPQVSDYLHRLQERNLVDLV
jgi:pyrroloquinoline quinone biosynthesis protein D